MREAHASVVDQHVDATPGREDRGHQFFTSTRRSDLSFVNGKSAVLYACKLAGDVLQRGLVAVVVQRQVETGSGELERDACPYASARACDQGDAALAAGRVAHCLKRGELHLDCRQNRNERRFCGESPEGLLLSLHAFYALQGSGATLTSFHTTEKALCNEKRDTKPAPSRLAPLSRFQK